MALWSAAFACLIGAALLVAAAGLPEHAQFSGIFVAGQGYVAPERGALAPDFTLATLAGESLSLASLRGQPVILNFWAAWCAPCRAEMPELEALYQRERDAGLRILAINAGEDASIVRDWADELELHFDLLLDADREVERLYRVRGQPTTYVLSPDQRIVAVFLGPTSAAALAQHLVYDTSAEKDTP